MTNKESAAVVAQIITALHHGRPTGPVLDDLSDSEVRGVTNVLAGMVYGAAVDEAARRGTTVAFWLRCLDYTIQRDMP